MTEVQKHSNIVSDEDLEGVANTKNVSHKRWR